MYFVKSTSLLTKNFFFQVEKYRRQTENKFYKLHKIDIYMYKKTRKILKKKKKSFFFVNVL